MNEAHTSPLKFNHLILTKKRENLAINLRLASMCACNVRKAYGAEQSDKLLTEFCLRKLRQNPPTLAFQMWWPIIDVGC